MPERRFELYIELGNDAMRSPRHVASALRKAAERLCQFSSDEGSIYDLNGNVVGRFKTVENVSVETLELTELFAVSPISLNFFQDLLRSEGAEGFRTYLSRSGLWPLIEDAIQDRFFSRVDWTAIRRNVSRIVKARDTK